MLLLTARFGEIEIEQERIINFPDGIPGFEDIHRFIIVSLEEHEPFAYLQSVDQGELAFIMIDPFEYVGDYSFELPDTASEQLAIDSSEQLLVRTIVNVQGDLSAATVNLIAPIIINIDKKLGKQVILTGTEYTTHHRLFPQNNSK